MRSQLRLLNINLSPDQTRSLILDGNYDPATTDIPGLIVAAASKGYTSLAETLLDLQYSIPDAGSAAQIELQSAAGAGRFDVVGSLLRRYVRGSLASHDLLAAFQSAAKGGHLNIVRFLVDKVAHIDARHGNCKGRTALQAATKGGHINTMNLLLSRGANINDCRPYCRGQTALQVAAEGGNNDIVIFLLERGADVNAPEFPNGLSRLQAAARSGPLEVVNFLLETGAIIRLPPSGTRRTALQVAAKAGHLNAVKLLLDMGADIHRSGALLTAAKYGQLEIVTLLLEMGADITYDPHPHGANHRASPLRAAVRGGHLKVVRFLLEKGVHIKPTLPWGNLCTHDTFGNVLTAVARGGNPEIVTLLVEMDTTTYPSPEPLYIAAELGYLEPMSVFLERHASLTPKRCPKFWEELLSRAARGGDPKVMGLLLEFGVPSGHHAALQIASHDGKPDIVALLLDTGFDINSRYSGQIPIEAAVAGGQLETIRYLLSRGASAEQDDNPNALSAAAGGGYLEIVLLLLDKYSYDVSSYDGTLAFVAALEHGHFTIVKLLIKRGLDIGGRFFGYFPEYLEAAVKAGSVEFIQSLWHRGLNPNRSANF